MISLELVNLSIDGPLDERRHKEVAFFFPDAHQNISPIFHRDARRRTWYWFSNKSRVIRCLRSPESY